MKQPTTKRAKRTNKPICVAVDADIMRKIRVIMYAKSSPENMVTLKQVFDAALLDYIGKWEADNGPIMEACFCPWATARAAVNGGGVVA